MSGIFSVDSTICYNRAFYVKIKAHALKGSRILISLLHRSGRREHQTQNSNEKTLRYMSASVLMYFV